MQYDHKLEILKSVIYLALIFPIGIFLDNWLEKPDFTHFFGYLIFTVVFGVGYYFTAPRPRSRELRLVSSIGASLIVFLVYWSHWKGWI